MPCRSAPRCSRASLRGDEHALRPTDPLKAGPNRPEVAVVFPMRRTVSADAERRQRGMATTPKSGKLPGGVPVSEILTCIADPDPIRTFHIFNESVAYEPRCNPAQDVLDRLSPVTSQPGEIT